MDHTINNSNRLRLKEFGEPVIVNSDDIEAELFAESNRKWRKILGLSGDPIRVENIGNSKIKLRAEHVTGVIKVGDIDIEIIPKFLDGINDSWQSILWKILIAVQGGYIDDNLTSAKSRDSFTIQDLLAEMFLASFTRGGSRGLPNHYKEVKEVGHSLRGRLDPERMTSWLSRPWELPYISDQLTDDTSLSKLFRWTAESLSYHVKSPSRARALREISSSLSHVGKLPPHVHDAQRLTLGPQYKALEPAKLVGVLLLEGAGVHHANGQNALSGFLWNSDKIYENYIYLLCKRAAITRDMRVNKKQIDFGRITAGIGTTLKTTPDVVFYTTKGVPFAIADAKYKKLGTRPKAQDTYQVLTAGNVLGCHRVALTYPVSTPRTSTTWQVESALGGREIELTALPVNLMSLSSKNGLDTIINSILVWLDSGWDAGKEV